MKSHVDAIVYGMVDEPFRMHHKTCVINSKPYLNFFTISLVFCDIKFQNSPPHHTCAPLPFSWLIQTQQESSGGDMVFEVKGVDGKEGW